MWNEKHLWIVVNVYAKYHHVVPNGSKFIERTQYLPYTIGSQLWFKSLTLAFDLEIWTCNVTHTWMVMNIYAKYHNLALNGSQMIERTHLVAKIWWKLWRVRKFQIKVLKWQWQLCSRLVSIGQVVSEEKIFSLSKVYRRWHTSSDGNTFSWLWSRPAKNESSNEPYLSFWDPNITFCQGMNENHYTKIFFFIQQQNKNTKLFILHASKVKLTQYPTRYKNNMTGFGNKLRLY
jgi:hypothetical protein